MTVRSFPADVRGRHANIVSRGIAGCIDATVVAVANLVTLFAIKAVWALLAGEGSATEIALPDIVVVGVLTGIFWGYFAGSWWLFGRTAGQWLFGLRVVRTDGSRVRLLRAWVRLLLTGLSTAVFFLGWIWIALDRRGQAWHDKFCDTLVVYDFTPPSKLPEPLLPMERAPKV